MGKIMSWIVGLESGTRPSILTILHCDIFKRVILSYLVPAKDPVWEVVESVGVCVWGGGCIVEVISLALEPLGVRAQSCFQSSSLLSGPPSM